MKSIQFQLGIFLFIIIFVIVHLVFNLKYFNIYSKNVKSFFALTNLGFNFNLSNTKDPKIFCFVKTHPGNFKSRLPKNYNNCIRFCSDYRYFKVLNIF